LNQTPTDDPFLDSMNEVADLIAKVRGDAYPELADRQIGLRRWEHEYAFFSSRPIIMSMLTFWRPMRFAIFANPRIFDMEIALEAVEAIMAHELAHTAWYVRQGRWATLGLFRIAISHAAKARFERATDVDALIRGYGPGIKAYRQHIYPRLKPEHREIKGHNYFSPAEIDAAVAGLAECPALGDHWLNRPPMNLDQIHRDIDQAQKGAL